MTQGETIAKAIDNHGRKTFEALTVVNNTLRTIANKLPEPLPNRPREVKAKQPTADASKPAGACGGLGAELSKKLRGKLMYEIEARCKQRPPYHGLNVNNALNAEARACVAIVSDLITEIIATIDLAPPRPEKAIQLKPGVQLEPAWRIVLDEVHQALNSQQFRSLFEEDMKRIGILGWDTRLEIAKAASKTSAKMLDKVVDEVERKILETFESKNKVVEASSQTNSHAEWTTDSTPNPESKPSSTQAIPNVQIVTDAGGREAIYVNGEFATSSDSLHASDLVTRRGQAMVTHYESKQLGKLFPVNFRDVNLV